MKKTQSILMLSITFVLLSAVLLWAAVPQQTDHDDHASHDHAAHAGQDHAEADHADHDDHDGTSHEGEHSAACPVTLVEMQLPAALASVDKATKAVKFGDKRTALLELNKLRQLLAQVQHDWQSAAKPGPVNKICPIMGNKIDPAKVTPALTRTYQGKKIAFCCAGCLPQWDKMTALQRTAKLKALAPAETAHNPNDGGDHTGHVH